MNDTPTKHPKPFPWRSTPAQSHGERLAFAADLAALLDNPTTHYATARATFSAATLGLSGEELHDLGRLLCQQLQTVPTLPEVDGGAE